ncbi:MAG: CCA tRNA nucleotidyltransferase [Candidatus Omnitrophica bacterium]|nr:CCA tRNA nucleotidyltransferase [Candidatus Omnitrophota bacterium]
MIVDFSKLDKKIYQFLLEAGEVADRKGVSLDLVGGMVRDLILARPSVDIDLVVEGNGMAFARFLSEKWGGQALYHERFLTAALTLSSGLKVDVASARREIYSKPGALPTVRPGTFQEDSFRRDFTINTLAVSLNKASFGVLRDDCHGLLDLKAGRIAVMHEKSFLDDPTRILRAARYQERFGFQIEPVTFKLLREAVKNGALETVSPIRYFNEFRRMLEEENPVFSLKRLQAFHAARFFPCDSRHLAFLRKAVSLAGEISQDFSRPLFYLMVLADGVDRNRIGRVFTDLNFPREVKQKILEALQFATVLDMLVRNPDSVKLEKFSTEALFFFLLKAWSVKLRKGLVLELRKRGVMV